MPKPLTFLRYRLGWIVLPQSYAHLASCALQVLPHITHNQDVYDHDIITRGGIFGAARPSIILNALTPPLSYAAHFFTML